MALRAERDGLREALEKYGKHPDSCPKGVGIGIYKPPAERNGDWMSAPTPEQAAREWLLANVKPDPLLTSSDRENWRGRTVSDREDRVVQLAALLDSERAAAFAEGFARAHQSWREQSIRIAEVAGADISVGGYALALMTRMEAFADPSAPQPTAARRADSARGE